MSLPSQDVQEFTISRPPPDPLRVRDWFVVDDRPALYSVDGRQPMTYAMLRSQLDTTPTKLRGRIALMCKPDETAEFATALLSLMDHGCTACPLDSKLSSEDLSAAILQLRCTVAVASERSAQAFETTKLPVLVIKPNSNVCGCFEWIGDHTQFENKEPISHVDSPLILLRTSGTTSKPKVVPLTGLNLHYNARAIATSLALVREDCCLNVMPFFHIGGISCSLLAVLCSGSQVICAPTFDVFSFVDWLEGYEPRPTWYYAVPTIHKTLLLYLQNRKSIKTSLRLVRSGAAHLPHGDALALSKILGCSVMPTYSMSECMPVCSTPMGWSLEKADTVGQPIGPSLRIADDSGNALPYGEQGEVLVRGPGVMGGYEGMRPEEVFAQGVWLRTGDMGEMDRNGCVFLKGRKKEMIKRGGEQISLHEVDEALRSHPAVQVCVAFGIKNDFWGEEVAAAIVLKDNLDVMGTDQRQREILASIRSKLAGYKVPKQLLFVVEKDLPKTATGKYKRNGLAEVLNAKSVDHAAMKSVMASSSVPESIAVLSNAEKKVAEGDKKVAEPMKPSKSLHGLRFILALCVTQNHIGQFPTKGWSKIRSFSINMIGFIFLAGFMLACSTARKIPPHNRRDFWISRFGAMHALYIMACLYSYPDYLIQCTPSSCPYDAPYDYDMVNYIFIWVVGVPMQFLGLYYYGPMTNGVCWFQSALYFCILWFPYFDLKIRMWKETLWCYMVPCLCFSTFIMFALAMTGFPFMILYANPISWIWCFFCGIIMAHMFKANTQKKTPNGRFWAITTDGISLLFLIICVVIGYSDCWVDEDGYTCDDMTYEQWTHTKMYNETGRWNDIYVIYLGGGGFRFLTPVIAVWIYGLAVGKGITAKLFSATCLVKYLGPLAYPLYLFHLPTSMYYYFIVHGIYDSDGKKKWWFPIAAGYPVPVAWYEYFIIVVITLIISFIVNEWLNPPLIPLMMRFFSRFFSCFCSPCKNCLCPVKQIGAFDNEALRLETTFERVQAVIRNLTGAEITPSTSLGDIGLDSFGVSALVGALRSSFPCAQSLRPSKIRELADIGSLVDHLEELQHGQETSRLIGFTRPTSEV